MFLLIVTPLKVINMSKSIVSMRGSVYTSSQIQIEHVMFYSLSTDSLYSQPLP